MVRCRDCKKTFRQHFGKNWEDGLCYKCWKKDRILNFTPPPPKIRFRESPTDAYLDRYMFQEINQLDS